MTHNANGIVIYRGPSMLDGAPIVAIATGFERGSRNVKTGGGLIQTWIIREDVSPIEAANSGADASICGACPHRGDVVRDPVTGEGRNVGRSCYVTLHQAPLAVWKAFHRGVYAHADDLAMIGAGRNIRLGSYGDPAAVPVAVWDALTSRAATRVGYTHQWSRFPEMARHCMASADSHADRAAAKLLGFRTFRVTAADVRADRGDREVICPASVEMGKRTTCDACKACGGTSAKARADIVIQVHGAPSKIAAAALRAS